ARVEAKKSGTRDVNPIDSIVIHHCDDPFFGSCVNTLLTASDKSAHYVVSNQGEILQILPDAKAALHATYYNGMVYNKNSPTGKVSDLHSSIGIETQGNGTKPKYVTDLMEESLANLVALLLIKYPTIEQAGHPLWPSDQANSITAHLPF